MWRYISVLLALTANICYSQQSDTSECYLILKESGVEHLAATWCSSEERSRCADSHGGGAFCDVEFAVAKEMSALDSRLSVSYRKIMTAVPEAQQKRIQESQEAWVKYRELECHARLGMVEDEDALIRSNLFNACIMNFTKERVNQLVERYCAQVGGC